MTAQTHKDWKRYDESLSDASHTFALLYPIILLLRSHVQSPIVDYEISYVHTTVRFDLLSITYEEIFNSKALKFLKQTDLKQFDI